MRANSINTSAPLAFNRNISLLLVKQNHEILIDDEDYSIVSGYTWHIVEGSSGVLYAQTHLTVSGKRTTKLMHKLILNAARVDHINRNGLDNRKTNLRAATAQQNGANAKKRNGTSKYKGVHWNIIKSKWQASIFKDNTTKYLGLFNSELEAAKRYDKEALEVYGEFAHLNIKE